MSRCSIVYICWTGYQVRNDPPRPQIQFVYKVPEWQIRRRLTPTLPSTESLENVVEASFTPDSEIYKYFVVYTGLELQVTLWVALVSVYRCRLDLDRSDTDTCIISSKSLKIVGIPLENIHHDVAKQRLTFTSPPGAFIVIIGSVQQVEQVAQSMYGKSLQDFVLKLKTYIATDTSRLILSNGTGDSVSGIYQKGYNQVYVWVRINSISNDCLMYLI